MRMMVVSTSCAVAVMASFAESCSNVVINSARVSGLKPVPGRKRFIATRPITTEKVVVSRKKARARPPMRPNLERSPSRATPAASDAKTNGTTTIKSKRRKICPIGYAIVSVAKVNQPFKTCDRSAISWLTIPTIAPRIRPIKIFQ